MLSSYLSTLFRRQKLKMSQVILIVVLFLTIILSVMLLSLKVETDPQLLVAPWKEIDQDMLAAGDPIAILDEIENAEDLYEIGVSVKSVAGIAVNKSDVRKDVEYVYAKWAIYYNDWEEAVEMSFGPPSGTFQLELPPKRCVFVPYGWTVVGMKDMVKVEVDSLATFIRRRIA